MALLKCKYPIVLERGRAFGCGQCAPCRVNKRREWTHRIMLEAGEHEDNCFLTLSYDEDNVPEDGSLRPKDLSNFLKRLRKRYGKFRYYAVGEYGGNSERPHYHAILFGFHTCWRGQTLHNRRNHCCARCALTWDAWQKGSVHLARVGMESAAYVAGYTVKQKLKDTDLDGRHPEFARMSNRPGIGAQFAHEIADAVLRDRLEYVPRALRHGDMVWPLGNYLTKLVSKYCGDLPIAEAESAVEVQVLSQKIFTDEEIRSGHRFAAFREALIQKNLHRAEALERREKRKIRNEAF